MPAPCRSPAIAICYSISENCAPAGLGAVYTNKLCRRWVELDNVPHNRAHETNSSLQLPTCFANTEPYGVKPMCLNNFQSRAAIDEDQGLHGGIKSPQTRSPVFQIASKLPVKKCFLKTLRPAFWIEVAGLVQNQFSPCIDDTTSRPPRFNIPDVTGRSSTISKQLIIIVC